MPRIRLLMKFEIALATDLTFVFGHILVAREGICCKFGVHLGIGHRGFTGNQTFHFRKKFKMVTAAILNFLHCKCSANFV